MEQRCPHGNVSLYSSASQLYEGQTWAACTLCRSAEQSRSVLERAKQRQVEWPQPKSYNSSQDPIQDPSVYTNIDDAFATILQYMTSTSRQCKRYYKSCWPKKAGEHDNHHCSRFHTPEYTQAQRKNPLQTAEDVHLNVQPGNYAITAGEWGTQQQQTHVVRVDNGQSVNLNFVM